MSAYDNSGSVEGVAVSTVNFSFTTSGSNRALVANVHIVDDLTPATVSAITYNSVSLGAARNDVTNLNYVRTMQFAMANPAVGANTLSVTLNNVATYHLVLGAVSATAVDQTTPVRAGSPVTGSADNASPTVNCSSATDDLVVDAVTITQSSDVGVAPAAGASQTQRYTQIAPFSGVGGSTEPGAATVTMSWTTTGIGAPEWALAALSLQNAAAGGGGSTQTLTETFSLADQQISGARRPRGLDDAASVSDSTIRKLIRGRVTTDTTTIFDDPTRTIQMIYTDEGVTLDDTLIQWRRLVRRLDESAEFIDQIIKSVSGAGTTYTRTLSEAIEYSDGFVSWLRYRRVADDPLDVIDGFSKLIAGAGITYARILSDSVQMIDDNGNRWIFRRNLSTDTFALVDQIIRGAVRGRIQNEAIAFNDALTKWVRLARLLGDDVEFIDGEVRVRNILRVSDDPIDLTDELIRSLFLDQLQQANFRLGASEDPFRFAIGSLPFN